MASERKTGLGSLPAGLLQPTTPPDRHTIPAEPEATAAAGDEGVDQAEARAGGPQAEGKAPLPRTRKKRAPVSTETKGRKLHLPDDVHDRLWLLARQRRTSVSTVAAEILDRNLPRYRIEREG